jgi:hypothetical protein
VNPNIAYLGKRVIYENRAGEVVQVLGDQLRIKMDDPRINIGRKESTPVLETIDLKTEVLKFE